MARSFGIFLIVLVVGGLGGAVLYLLSDINQRNYRVVAQEGNLVVERGRMLPLGYHVYEPDTPALRQAYAPMPLPPNEVLGPSEVFNDRADLDRALFVLLAGWARDRLYSDQPGDFDLASAYIRRTELLPGLSEEQRSELRTLRGDLAYRSGRRMLVDIVERLSKARSEFELSMKLGTSQPNDAQRWISHIDQRIARYMDSAKLERLSEQQPPFGQSTEQQPSDSPTPGQASEPEEQGGSSQPRWRL